MSHIAIVWAVNQVARAVSDQPEIILDGRSIPQLSAQQSIIGWIAITITVLVVSALVYRFVEKPYRETSRRFAFRRLSPVHPAKPRVV